jgi:hypothetical protein
VTTAETIRPETYRLPKPGTSDPYWGFSRAFYYLLNRRLAERGEKLLIRCCGEGRRRGVTLVRYEVVASYVRSQMEAQDG